MRGAASGLPRVPRVSDEVVRRQGLASSAAEAWAQGGGGAFKRKITKAGGASLVWDMRGLRAAQAFLAL
jgi:hypothetical protein